MSSQNPLQQFHPLIQRWFKDRLGVPTDAQQKAWAHIVSGEHVLISSPTGTGKTMAAFLWALDRFVTGAWACGATRVLYVSPLKALNRDVRQNLLTPLDELQRIFFEAGKPFPEVRVMTRSGDTPQSDRRRMLRRPPEILITTPESLALLLNSSGRSILGDLNTVILDEIHAVAPHRRGVFLMSGVERLVKLSGEFQRIALSATVRPLPVVAEFVGGFSFDGKTYFARPVALVESSLEKQYEMDIRSLDTPVGNEFWPPMVQELKALIAERKTTLIFVNARRLAERLAHMLNEHESEPVAYAHHGSLSREIRTEVERRFKAGELQALVATSSLEMGIDIGDLDQVVLIQAPPSISAAIQRLGRAGHTVGQPSQGMFFPTHGQDLLEAAVLVQAVKEHGLEEIRPVVGALDVLVQVLLGIISEGPSSPEDLYHAVRCATPYRELSRAHFDLALDLLAGRYEGTRLRELQSRIAFDRLANTVTIRPGSTMLLYLSGGVIPDRGYFCLRHAETGARIGELDEEFVWENDVGSLFSLGTQSWKVVRVTQSDVFVQPHRGGGAPFWKGEPHLRDFHFSEQIGLLLERMAGRLDKADMVDELRQDHAMNEAAAKRLVTFLRSQERATRCGLPHRHHLVVEMSSLEMAPSVRQIIIHTFWGGRVNRPYALALEAAWEERFGTSIEIAAVNDSLTLMVSQEVDAEELLSLVSSGTLEELLRRRVEVSGFFAARFRECAGRALLIPRRHANERMPLWLSRLRAQKLMASVQRFGDFPILLETWRTCLQDEFDLDVLRRVLTELERGEITWSEARTDHPSPMARAEAWRQTNEYMYQPDAAPADAMKSSLRDDLFRDLMAGNAVSRSISKEVIEEFEAKRVRIYPGYAPSSSSELLECLKDRVWITGKEWSDLILAMQRDHQLSPKNILNEVRSRCARCVHGRQSWIVARESIPRILHAVPVDMKWLDLDDGLEIAVPASEEQRLAEVTTSSLLGEWLSFRGPVDLGALDGLLGLEAAVWRSAVEDLVTSQMVVLGHPLLKGSEEEQMCDMENYEILLRMERRASAPQVDTRPLAQLPLFLARHQGLTGEETTLEDSLDRLALYPAPAGLWESDILPARLSSSPSAELDALIHRGDLAWTGYEKKQLLFYFKGDEDLLPQAEGEEGADNVEELFGDRLASYDFMALLQRSGLDSAELTRRLWEAVWRGEVTNDSFAVLRQGLASQFRPRAVTESNVATSFARGRRTRQPGGRRDRGAWQSSRPLDGKWRLVSRAEQEETELGVIEQQQRSKECVRLLLDRHGILFRELLQRELPHFRWGVIFPTLRLMELSGELLSGCFFDEIMGPQFVSQAAYHRLCKPLDEEQVYWLNAADPISLCGVRPCAQSLGLPRRLPGTHLVYHGSRLVMVSTRKGKDLQFHVPPDDPNLTEYLTPLHHLLIRSQQPLRRIVVETINTNRADQSPYLAVLAEAFTVTKDYRKLNLTPL